MTFLAFPFEFRSHSFKLIRQELAAPGIRKPRKLLDPRLGSCRVFRVRRRHASRIPKRADKTSIEYQESNENWILGFLLSVLKIKLRILLHIEHARNTASTNS